MEILIIFGLAWVGWRFYRSRRRFPVRPMPANFPKQGPEWMNHSIALALMGIYDIAAYQNRVLTDEEARVLLRTLASYGRSITKVVDASLESTDASDSSRDIMSGLRQLAATLVHDASADASPVQLATSFVESWELLRNIE